MAITIDEAIHVQQLHLDGDPKLKDIKLRQGMHLGIEALKRIKAYKEGPLGTHYQSLPGETEE